MSTPTADPARGVLLRAGLVARETLGSGVEGTVVALADDTVAKVWWRRPLAEVERLATFYDAVAAGRPALATPRIERVLDVDGVVISVERRLRGYPLWMADGGSPDLTTARIDAVLEALAALAGVPGAPSLRSLPLLPGEPPLAGDEPFEHELADLVVRRAHRSRTLLSARLPDLDTLVADVNGALRALPPAAPALVHGDLIAANVLAVDGRASAIVDFGFLTTVGDPAFDAAVAASCFDMYGPRAAEVEAALEAEIRAALGYDAARLTAYHLAYALATATCFSADGSDGHFAWCAGRLERLRREV